MLWRTPAGTTAVLRCSCRAIASLRFAPHVFEVNWQLTSLATFRDLRQSWPSDPAPIRVRRHRPDGTAAVSEMDTPAMVSTAVGKTIRRLVIDEIGVYLHFVNDSRWLGFFATSWPTQTSLS